MEEAVIIGNLVARLTCVTEMRSGSGLSVCYFLLLKK
jgi:hypothetical protein